MNLRPATEEDLIPAGYRQEERQQRGGEPAVNGAAVALLASPPVLLFRGVRLPSPPASVPHALQINAARTALEDPACEDQEAHLRALLALLWTMATGPGWRGWFARGRFLWRNPFLRLTAEEVAAVASFFLDTPDDAPARAPAAAQDDARAPDLLDLLTEACTAGFPAAWYDADGLPRTWRHFVYMGRHTARGAARSQIRAATAAGVPHLTAEDAKDWWRDTLNLSGWGPR